jgi:hypothetical protein
MVQSGSERAPAFNAAVCFSNSCRKLPQSTTSPVYHRHRVPLAPAASQLCGLIVRLARRITCKAVCDVHKISQRMEKLALQQAVTADVLER